MKIKPILGSHRKCVQEIRNLSRLIIGILFHDRTRLFAYESSLDVRRWTPPVSLSYSAAQVVVSMITPIIVSTSSAFVVSFLRTRNTICGFKPTHNCQSIERLLTQRWDIYQCDIRTIITFYL